jgi:hypothetical protein
VLGLSPEQIPGAWKALAHVAGKALQDVFEPVAFVENLETDTQVRFPLKTALFAKPGPALATKRPTWP